ncbi:prepilin-type N-terminal cleavage/methylation domain-containing protein [Candidatus Fermentibacterales bacterium]|nr:prepilin-type N-terminal cleavage/methylation domain-containing protein [Candidatus Fermentibacterales bacterium]
MIRRGFTLIELMIVVVIIGILAAIAIPKFTSVKDQANQSSCRTNMRALASAEAVYYAKYDSYTMDFTNLDLVMGNASVLECPIGHPGDLYVLNAHGHAYRVTCPNNGPAVDHGSIIDGIASWI